MNPEKLNFNSIEKENLNNIEVHLDHEPENFVNIETKDILTIKEDIDIILGTQWDLEDQKIDYYSFSNRENFEDFIRNNIPDNINFLKENAVFYVDPETQTKKVLNYTPIPSEEEISKGKSYGYDLNERRQMVKSDILSSFAHETTHMHPFFKSHGNENTANMWEQEEICAYVGEKTRGNISDILLKKNLITEERIDSFDLKDGEWNNSKKVNNIVINYFYPFLIKKYGIEKIRMVWEELQDNPDLEFVLKEVLNQEPKNVIDMFKEKIKNRQYLENIFN